MRNIVHLSKNAEKSLKKAPPPVQMKAALWQLIIETKGIREARLRKGFHDEPLSGKRQGERSVRLNLKWRAIYHTKIESEGTETIELVDVTEVTPHKY